jgi:hypothetical protein
MQHTAVRLGDAAMLSNCSYYIPDLYYTYTTGTQTWYLGISLQPQRDFVACTLYMTLVVRLSTVTPTSHEQDTCSTGCAWSDTAIRDVPAWTLTLRLPRLSFLVSLRFRPLSHVSTWVRRFEISQQALLGVHFYIAIVDPLYVVDLKFVEF